MATERNTLDWLFSLQPNYQKGTRCSRDAECLGTTPPPPNTNTPNENAFEIRECKLEEYFSNPGLRVTETRTNFGTKYPCSGKTALRFYRCRGGLTANRRHDHAHRCTRKLLSRFYGSTHRLVICAITQHFNCFLILHAFLCSTVTRNLKPSNPGFFCPHTNPGLTSLKTFETLLPGFSGTRVAFPIRDKRAVSLS